MKYAENWGDAQILSVRDLTPTVREFTLVPACGCTSYVPGSHLQLQVTVGGAAQTRSYSLVGRPDGQAYRIAVKRLADGRGGSRAMWALTVGDSLRISEPLNHFAFSERAPAYWLVAGGIGVTPLVGMAQALRARAAQVHMDYAAHSEAELAYADSLHAVLGGALRCRVGQRIDFDTGIARLPVGAQLVVCGPLSMLESAQRAWVAAGRPAADLCFETFGNSGHLAAQAFEVVVPRHGVNITVPPASSLLAALEQAGVQVLSDCQRGECGLCVMDVLALEGQIDHRDVYLDAAQRQANTRICACVSRVVGRITLDSAYRPQVLPWRANPQNGKQSIEIPRERI